ncbi:MAG: ArsB/NhaD family transporter [Clostridiales bacterium]|nr:ArsB/NhaD family transporter [Clostridiales bacterium]MCF8023463.1 ArsB/NhaD family transporter [Clostridiales bacterium]
MSTQVIFVLAVFLITYAIIISEKIHRAVIAFVGAAVLIFVGILTPELAVKYIDWNTIGLLVGMMIIVGITRETGVFEFLAIKAAKAAHGRPLAIMASLAAITAISSALLDNVTTVLLVVPVTFAIAKKLELSPIPFLIVEILSSNIGGTATLIGDPPNIMIGSATHLGFVDFVINLAPVIILVHVITVFICQLIYKRRMVITPQIQQRIYELDEKQELKDVKLMKKCILVLGLTILGFFLHQVLHLESSVIALSGASLLLLITNSDPEHPLQNVEWPVIFFFLGLFVIVGGLEEVGIIKILADFLLELTGGVVLPTGVLILWMSSIFSAFVDNIPYCATMIPLIKSMAANNADINAMQNFLWWSLSLGACLGGNGTIIGASANVVVIGMAEKQGARITFMKFFKIAFPLMVMSIIIANVYIWMWFVLPRLVTLVGTLVVSIIAAGILSIFNRRLAKQSIQESTSKNINI